MCIPSLYPIFFSISKPLFVGSMALCSPSSLFCASDLFLGRRSLFFSFSISSNSSFFFCTSCSRWLLCDYKNRKYVSMILILIFLPIKLIILQENSRDVAIITLLSPGRTSSGIHFAKKSSDI